MLALRYCAAVTVVGLRMRRKNMKAVASERANLRCGRREGARREGGSAREDRESERGREKRTRCRRR